LGALGHLSAKCPDSPQLKHLPFEKYFSNLDTFFFFDFLNFLGKLFEVKGLLNFLSYFLGKTTSSPHELLSVGHLPPRTSKCNP
jgi:hypothetical protein